MKHLSTLAVVTLMVAASTRADAQKIQISPQVKDQAFVRIIIESVYNFERSLSLKVRPNMASLSSDKLIKLVNALNMRDGLGIKIVSGWDIDPKKNVIIGFSGGSADIIKAHKTAKGLRIVASFKDAQGNFVTPPASSIAAYNSFGDKLCFSYQDIAVAEPPMLFALLLDRSGSMSGVIDDVKLTAYRFLDALPDSANCMVTSFNERSQHHSKTTSPECRSRNFDFDGIKAGGATDIYTPLQWYYELMAAKRFEKHQKAVIIITDGKISDNPAKALSRKAALSKAKKDTLTFIYWLGDRDEKHLKGLADSFIKNTGSLRASIARYFHVLSDAYAKQRVLTIHSCKRGKKNAP